MALHDLPSLCKCLRDLLPSLNESFGVGQLWIVGSRARGEHRPNSDLDLLVEFERRGISLLGFCRMERQLSDALGVKVDLVERGVMHPVVAASLEQDAIEV